jgi:ribosomal protein L37E
MDRERQAGADDKKAFTVKCVICEKDTEPRKSFVCRRCGKSPFCLEHLDSELKICSGCAAEERIRLYNNLSKQGKSIRGFFRLFEFIFIVAAIFFVAGKLFSEHLPEFITENIFFQYLFLWGGVAVAGIILCFILLQIQQQKIKEIEERLQSHKVYSRYLHR